MKENRVRSQTSPCGACGVKIQQQYYLWALITFRYSDLFHNPPNWNPSIATIIWRI